MTNNTPVWTHTNFALDYDDTYTRDPDLWLDWVNRALEKGHTVKVVTMRYQYEGVTMDSRLLELVEVIFTERKAKRIFAKLKGYNVDVWIDDRPDFIVGDALL